VAEINQARGDLYAIADDLEFLKVQLMRLPTRGSQSHPIDDDGEPLGAVWRGCAVGAVSRAELVLVGCIMLVPTLAPSEGAAACGGEWDGQYSSAIHDRRLRFRDHPGGADDLTNCIQEASEDYRPRRIVQPLHRWRTPPAEKLLNSIEVSAALSTQCALIGTKATGPKS
jgi:hypothetical protein